MIGQRVPKLTPKEEARAYAIATHRDDGTCVRCRRGGLMSRDHRRNRSQGGRTTPGNLQLMCGTGSTGCHGWATAHPRAALDEGYAVPGYADPLEWPGCRWVPTGIGTLVQTWVLYDDEGGWAPITDADAERRMEGGT